ncbi:MAG: AI-2E family transporter [Alphaproteobacteria bacterium]|nr:AI-2E family transporter [Alphaproteobacteria bacterium]
MKIWKIVLGIAGVLLLLGLIAKLEAIVLPFVLAGLLAYLFLPAVEALMRRRVPRAAAAGLVLGGFIVIVISLVLFIVPIIQVQITEFLIQTPKLTSALWATIKKTMVSVSEQIPPDRMYKMSDAVGQIVFGVLNATGASLSRLWSGGSFLFGSLLTIVLTPVLMFYLLKDWVGLKAKTLDLVPQRYAAQTDSLLAEINGTLRQFLRGQLSVCLLLAVYYAVLFSVVGLNFGVVSGVTVGILSFIPYFGFIMAVAVSILLGLFQGLAWGWWAVLIVGLGVGSVLESYVLTPHLVGKRVGLHPLAVIFAVFAGGILFGFIGVLAAVPAAAILGVVARRALARYRTSALYKGKK